MSVITEVCSDYTLESICDQLQSRTVTAWLYPSLTVATFSPQPHHARAWTRG